MTVNKKQAGDDRSPGVLPVKKWKHAEIILDPAAIPSENRTVSQRLVWFHIRGLCTGGLSMVRVTTLAGCAILLAAFLVGTGRSGEKGGTPVKKAGLPKYWSKIQPTLTAEQRDKIIKSRTEYSKKIQALKAQLKKLEQEERAASYAVLTEEQKENLRKILGVEGSSGKKSSADKKSSKDK